MDVLFKKRTVFDFLDPRLCTVLCTIIVQSILYIRHHFNSTVI